MTSFSIQNFGCRVNQAEAFEWAGEFQKHGLKLEKDFRRSQIVLVNTCTLTSRADRDARRFIRKMARLNPQAKVVVTGCLVERDISEFRKMPVIWKIVPNREKNFLVDKVLAEIAHGGSTEVRPFRSRALLKIQDGCNLRCRFCIIPQVRGISQSLPREEVLSRVKRLAEEGFNEIVLTGIHLCSYGRDLKPRRSFLDLLVELEKIDFLKKIRLSSLDPRWLSSPLIAHITTSRKVCPHFHISLQSGSDRILALMGRMSRVSVYAKLLDRLRSGSPRASLGADIIVGFPGETEDDFEQTFRFLEESPLTYMHVFSYSPRPHTPASSWPQVEEKRKRERAVLLRELSKKKNRNFRRQFLGEELEALVVKRKNGSAEVVTPNYLKILLSFCPTEEGEEVRVRVTRINDQNMEGEIISL
ncbi:MAG: tRNA (N(6)-L-threonylcarbamoyladenosine(37)-C(2))-methylthiotransferase MtaB [Candidatus Aminicenantales bacterium]